MQPADAGVPRSLTAELQVLASVMMDPATAWPLVVDVLNEADFYAPLHRVVFRALVRMADDGELEAISPRSVRAALEKAGEFSRPHGEALREIVEAAGRALMSAASAAYYVRTVKEAAQRRALLQASGGIAELAQTDMPIEQVLDRAETMVFQIAENGARQGLEAVTGADIMGVIAAMENDTRGISSGLDDLDELTLGFLPGQLITVAGATGMGKTSFAWQVAGHVARTRPVGGFSLEMSKEELVWRMLCNEARIDGTRFRKVGLQGYPDAAHALQTAAATVNGLSLFIDDQSGVSLSQIRARCRRLAAEQGGLGLVIVDYLQIMAAAGDSRVQALGEITTGLKTMARELECPVMLLSQLSREVEKSPDKKPRLSHLRESGSIEQDSDTVIFLFRPEYYFGERDSDGNTLTGRAEIIVAKQRGGRVGTVNAYFRAESTRFEQFTRRPEVVRAA